MFIGFSFTASDGGYPSTDEQLAFELLDGLTQFMLLFPYMVPGAISSQTPVYAFGESYGGAYVVSLAHVYLLQRYFSIFTNVSTNILLDKKFILKTKINAIRCLFENFVLKTRQGLDQD